MDIKTNKTNAVAFYKTAFDGNPTKAVSEYVGDYYIQHNPSVPDGKHGFIDYFDRMAEEFPIKSIEILRCVGEGDLVVIHSHQKWPGNKEYVTMDFFRFDDNGKICEHWDAIQKIPTLSNNSNAMY